MRLVASKPVVNKVADGIEGRLYIRRWLNRGAVYTRGWGGAMTYGAAYASTCPWPAAPVDNVRLRSPNRNQWFGYAIAGIVRSTLPVLAFGFDRLSAAAHARDTRFSLTAVKVSQAVAL